MARKALDEMLRLNLLPFWRRVADESRREGFDLNHDVVGRWRGPADPSLVSQARMLWFFAHLRRHGMGEAADAERAVRGYEILTRRFRDPVHGGFFWQIATTDYQPIRADKQLYGQAFALFSLSEHALATGAAPAAGEADGAFAAIEQKMRSPATGNYHEFRLRDWTAPPPDRRDYLDQPAGTRSHNTRIHLLEALTTYHELRSTPLVGARLAEVVALTEAALVRTPVYYFREVDGRPPTRQSYGHDIETIHLLMRARARLGRCGAPPAFYGRVVDDALRVGEDPERGGLFFAGPAGSPPDERHKQDWVQAEALLALMELYRLTRTAARKAAFFRLVDWLGRYQVDWANKSWHATITPELRAQGGKAGPWRGPYHAGRALIDCLRLLKAIGDGAPSGGCTFV